MRKIKVIPACAVFFFFFWSTSCTTKKDADKPNFVIIFTDDQGYQDLGCFGSPSIQSPNIDKMAEEGIKLTSFYVAAPLCTPSRAALMTGSYPTRINMAEGVDFPVLLDADSKGLNPDEITIAEVLKSAGYKTGMFGKWHLGDQPEFLPTRQGFDEFFGLPYSYDISPFHQNKKYNFSPLPLLEGETVIEENPDCDQLTRRITERSVQFIETHKDQPFFLYIAHPDPHRPIYVSPDFIADAPDSIKERLEKEDGYVDYAARDQLYKYAINEIDWSVGQVLKALKKAGIDENTVVLFTSDNGPTIGSAKPLRGKKGGFREGGVREPAVIRWPGKISGGQVNDNLLTTMDVLPTFARLAGAKIPDDRVIDGKDIWPVLVNNAESPHEAFFYHQRRELKAVRSGEWKLHVNGNKPVALYNLEDDISESKNVMEENHEVVDKLLSYVDDFQNDIEKNNRPAAFVDDPKPLSKPINHE